MHYDDIRIQAIYTRRVSKVGTNVACSAITVTANLVSHEPPDVFEKMGSRDGRDTMPEDRALQIIRRICGGEKGFDLLDLLGIEMDFPSVIFRESLNLFDDAGFGAMLTVEERRDNGESQISPAWDCLIVEERRLQVGQTAPGLADEKVCPASSKGRHSRQSPDRQQSRHSS